MDRANDALTWDRIPLSDDAISVGTDDYTGMFAVDDVGVLLMIAVPSSEEGFQVQVSSMADGQDVSSNIHSSTAVLTLSKGKAVAPLQADFVVSLSSTGWASATMDPYRTDGSRYSLVCTSCIADVRAVIACMQVALGRGMHTSSRRLKGRWSKSLCVLDGRGVLPS